MKEKGAGAVAVKEIAQRANVNRMTFHLHCDTVDDILSEYVDGMTEAILSASAEQGEMGVEVLLKTAAELMR